MCYDFHPQIAAYNELRIQMLVNENNHLRQEIERLSFVRTPQFKSVHDELPCDGQVCLCIGKQSECSSESVISKALYTKTFGWSKGLYYVTHWQPLNEEIKNLLNNK